MRAEIKARLMAELPDIAGRCYDAHEPTSATVKPYATVRVARQKETAVWTGLKRTYEIALCVEAGSTAVLDELADETMRLLHRVKLTGAGAEPDFTCWFAGLAAPDRFDEGLEALVRYMRFSVFAVGAESGTPGDPWLESLCGWTEDVAGSEWTVYRHHWPQHYTAPAVLWRLEQSAAKERNAATVELGKTMIGHVLGRTDDEQAAMVALLVEKLGGVSRLTIDQVANRHIVPGNVTGVCGADGLSAGQLAVTFRKVIQKTAPAAPWIEQIHYEGGFE